MSAPAGRSLPPSRLAEWAGHALQEDQAADDVTTRALVNPVQPGCARILAGDHLVVSGADMATAVFSAQDPAVKVLEQAGEGEELSRGQTVLALSGTCAALLSAERVALNYLQHLCGIATLARRAMEKVAGTGVRLLATRKTLPGLRALERRAAEAGGFTPHRFSLADGILIKDNHIAVAGSPAAAVQAARRNAPPELQVQVEVEDLAQMESVIAAGADMVLLDNFTPQQVARAVALAAGRAVLEASGGITLESLPAFAATGVDRISVGFVTHSAPAADLSLDLQPTGAGHVA